MADDVKTAEGAKAPSKKKPEPTAIQLAVAEVEAKHKADLKDKIAQGVARAMKSMEEDASAEADESLDMVTYTLDRSYWDGRKLHERGDVVKFRRGKAPKSAVLC